MLSRDGELATLDPVRDDDFTTNTQSGRSYSRHPNIGSNYDTTIELFLPIPFALSWREAAYKGNGPANGSQTLRNARSIFLLK